MQRLPTLSAVAAVLLLLPAASSARELYWKSLEVTATLDADGRLHVREEHAMVFDGDWNGGERDFLVRGRQELELESVARWVDGEWVPLTRGNLDRVDHWDWVGSTTLRWRSRLPQDPPFSQREIVYALDYSLENVLLAEEDGYVLDHDFSFADRQGRIEEFSLTLELAPEWTSSGQKTLSWRASQVPPGIGFPVYLELRHASSERLGAVVYPMAPFWRHAALGLSLIGIGVMWRRFWRREAASGRFDPLDAPRELDPSWIEEHIRSWRPEEVGALWDESVGAPEVSALIARWAAEGKVEGETLEPTGLFRRANMRLTRLVPAEAFPDYEGKLAKKLFVSGDSVTTVELRKHYRSKGFDPAGVIRREVERGVRRRLGRERGPAALKWQRTAAFFAAGALLFALSAIPAPELALGWGVLTTLAWLPLFGVGFLGALRWRHHVENLEVRLLWVLGPLVALACVYWWLPTLLSPPLIGYGGLAALVCFTLGTASFLFNQAATRAPRKRLEQRRRLFRLRDWWAKELEEEHPRLRDDDLPYLIALELQKAVDSWSVRFGSSASPTRGSTAFSTGGSSGSASWTGGGGAFGGAGATAAWTAGVAGLAGGVAAASSGSGGGGGGGGSSSGGGGGGGW